jgi:uncharacterized protein (TIGR02466 family)|tara:strand:+ start:121 stop:774 length:654 start_codon:yes stop_codon:yes gene_type:complete
MKRKIRELTVAKIPIQETKVFQYRYPHWEKLNSKLLPEIYQHNMDDPDGLPATNPLCWRGIKKYKSEKDLLKPISEVVSGWLAHYFPGKKFRADVNYWTNINRPGSLNMIHNHVMSSCHLSGVYYVEGETTGAIRFYTHEQLYNLIPDGMPYANKIGHAPSDGDILLFPSYLQHDVDVNLSTKNRITIGFNVILKRKKEKVSNVIPFRKGDKDGTKH